MNRLLCFFGKCDWIRVLTRRRIDSRTWLNTWSRQCSRCKRTGATDGTEPTFAVREEA